MEMHTIVADGMFDGRAFRAGPVAIELDGERIARIRRAEPSAPTGRYVVPGLVNAHVHIVRGGVFEANERISAEQALMNLEGTLAAGVTTVGDMGCGPSLIDALRRHTAKHPSSGPQIRASGPLLTAPRGYPLDWMPPLFAKLGIVLACDDEDRGKRAVQRVASARMDHVKLAVMHQSYSNRPMPAIREPVAGAIVEEAHRLGLRVLAHAHSNADYRVALAAGVDALMHSSFEPLDAEMVARIRDAGITVCPTLWVFESVCLGAELRLDRDERYTRHVKGWIERSWKRFGDAYAASGDVVPPGITTGLPKSRAKEAVRVAAANLALLREAKVPIAFGNDASYGFSIVARPIDELLAMHRAGMDATACLEAATRTAARLLGLDDRGAIEEGKRADLVVVDARITTDLGALESPLEVWAAGRPIGTDRHRAAGTRAFWSGLIRELPRALRA